MWRIRGAPGALSRDNPTMACGVRIIEDVAEVIHRDLTFDCEGMALAGGGVAASNAMPLGRRDAKLCRARRGH